MKRYIRASADRTTIKVHCINHSLGKFTFKDDVGNIYVYDRGAFPSSRFANDLWGVIYDAQGNFYSGAVITITTRLTPHCGRNNFFYLVSPRIISVG